MAAIFNGSDRHTLLRSASAALRIRLQPADLPGSQAPFDDSLQVWL